MKQVVGLTGGIATGKSTVSAMFRERGAVIVDADRIARDLLDHDLELIRGLVARFGPDVMAPDRSVDRAWLRHRIIEFPEDRSWLNARMHPEIKRREEEAVAAVTDGLVIVDAALLFETGSHRRFETIVVVYAPVEIQLARLMQRDGMDRASAKAFLATQMDIEEKRRLATHVIDNSGTLAETRRQVDRLYEFLAS